MEFLGHWVYICSTRVDNAQGFFEVYLPYLMKDMNLHIQEDQTLNRINSEIYAEKHTRNFSIRLRADFSSETTEARRQWDDLINMMKEENLLIKNST